MNTVTVTLADWLLQQIAEDEEWGRRFGCDDDHEGLDTSPRCRARVLAECATKRTIVEDAQQVPTVSLRHVLRLLALPYADRPGYLEEWRPGA